MKRYYAAGISLALAATPVLGMPITAAASTPEGALAITLTDSTGEPTDVATAGFDVEATTASRANLMSAIVGTARTARSGTHLTLASRPAPEAIEAELEADYALLTSPIAIDTPFAVAGITWDASETLPAGATIDMRTLDGGIWSPWYELEIAEGPDVEGARSGTEYALSGSSTGIQVRITHGQGELPANVRIDISYSDEGTLRLDDGAEVADVLPSAASLNDPALGGNNTQAVTSAWLSSVKAPAGGNNSSYATSATSLAAIPTTPYHTLSQETQRALTPTRLPDAASFLNNNAGIKPRSAWNANEALMTWSPYEVKFEGVIIHHTAGSNTYTQAQVPSVLQGIYYYHARTLGWGDIGYNVLIDKYGGRWEGRYGTLKSDPDGMVVGGHAKPRNTGTMGISVMGDYTSIQPSTTVLTALEEISAWKFILAGIDPTTPSALTVPDTTYVLKSQIGKPMNRIVGHMDVYPTSCPAKIYGYLPTIRSAVTKMYRTSLPALLASDQSHVSGNNVAMFRLYNRLSREHLYTSDANEAKVLGQGDWRYEGIGWVAPKVSSTPVYRLYNPQLGDHHYTTDKNEVDELTAEYGWRYEGIGWYSARNTKIPVYRQFCSWITIGSHNFTTDTNEYKVNNSRGWNGEGVAWYAAAKGWQAGAYSHEDPAQ